MRAIRRTTALPAALFALIGAVAPAAAASAPALANAPLEGGVHAHVLNSTSSNWAGYAATGSTFTSVTASWVQPTGSCTSSTTYSSFWIGLDGDGSNSVEQTGSEVDCSGGSPQYYAWYEMYPAYPVNFNGKVKPGDHFSASVTESSGGKFKLVLTDSTENWTQTINKTYSGAALASAEVIAEAPSSGSGVLPLTNFGTANFTSATVNGEPIGDYNPDAITMASGSTTKATTSALSGGSAFSVTWNHK